MTDYLIRIPAEWLEIHGSEAYVDGDRLSGHDIRPFPIVAEIPDGISGHVIWVGTLVPPPQDPDWDDMAGHFLSEQAGRAAVAVPRPATWTP